MTDEEPEASAQDRVTNPVAIAGVAIAVVALLLSVVSPGLSILVGVPAVACSAFGFRLYALGRGGRFPAAAGLVIGTAAVILPIGLYLTL